MTNLTTRKENKLQLDGNLITGDTYPVKDWLKTYCAGKWDKDRKGWIVDTEKLNMHIERGNSIALRIDDSPEANDTPSRQRKATGTAASSGWCDLCHSYCWGDCQAH
jgi:hypothetical protein